MIDIHHLRVFTLVADKKSFSQAAEELLLTQPTVSSHVRRLEESLGVTLFNRLPRGVELTKAGRLLYRHGKEILRLRDVALQSMREFAGTLCGSLEIGGSTIPGEYILPPLLGGFRQRAPEVEVHLTVADSAEITARILDGTLELGMVGARPEEASLETFPVCDDTLVIIVGPGHHLTSHTQPLSWKLLASEPLWLREPGSGTRKTLSLALATEGLRLEDLPILGQLGSTEAIKRAVQAGAGAGIVSSLAVEEEVACRRLFRLELPGREWRRQFFALRHRSRSPSPAATCFLEFLLAQVRATPRAQG